MRPLRYSINVALDGCCDHQLMVADEEQFASGAVAMRYELAAVKTAN